MEKRADSADISVLFFLLAVLIFWLYTRKQTVLFCTVLLALYYQYCAVSTVFSTVLLACYYEHCAFNTVLLPLCYQHCAISTVLLALCYQHCAISTVLKAVCYYAVLAQLGLIQVNSRCFGAHCKMSRNTRFLCYYFGLKYSSVLFSTLFPSLDNVNI